MTRLPTRRLWLQSAGAASALALAGLARADTAVDFDRALIQDNAKAMVNLIFRGADPNTRDSRGRPGLVAALHRDSLRVFDVLLQSPGIRLDETSAQGESALMMAAIKGHLAIARKLLDRGAAVHKEGWSALHYATSAALPDSLAMVQLLVRRGAPVDAPSPNGTTPLMMAAQYSSEDVVAQLLKYGADPLARNQRGWTAVDFARQASRDYLVDILTQAQRRQRSTQPGRKPGW
ncbi:ankyrin repeat domain-containing protein [Pantoea sp. 18069]|uniref:ankyrin repeat domain-containing protein n=1 Tax=Pantoea sp. 18069 TaxID=2681415 RepID=UPI00190F7DB8|nr:ankyrin repeat domain-containing protein [Pantoea sp. 18069]